MALTATIYQARLDIADSDRDFYLSTRLTLAQHPSETGQRMVARLLAWCLFADEALIFGRGISTRDEPDLWHKDLRDHICHWIDVGEPEGDRIRKASQRSDRVTLLPFGRQWHQWWQRNQKALLALNNVEVILLPGDTLETLANDLPRTFSWQVTISEGELFITDHQQRQVALKPQVNPANQHGASP